MNGLRLNISRVIQRIGIFFGIAVLIFPFVSGGIPGLYLLVPAAALLLFEAFKIAFSENGFFTATKKLSGGKHILILLPTVIIGVALRAAIYYKTGLNFKSYGAVASYIGFILIIALVYSIGNILKSYKVGLCSGLLYSIMPFADLEMNVSFSENGTAAFAEIKEIILSYVYLGIFAAAILMLVFSLSVRTAKSRYVFSAIAGLIGALSGILAGFFDIGSVAIIMASSVAAIVLFNKKNRDMEGKNLYSALWYLAGCGCGAVLHFLYYYLGFGHFSLGNMTSLKEVRNSNYLSVLEKVIRNAFPVTEKGVGSLISYYSVVMWCLLAIAFTAGCVRLLISKNTKNNIFVILPILLLFLAPLFVVKANNNEVIMTEGLTLFSFAAFICMIFVSSFAFSEATEYVPMPYSAPLMTLEDDEETGDGDIPDSPAYENAEGAFTDDDELVIYDTIDYIKSDEPPCEANESGNAESEEENMSDNVVSNAPSSKDYERERAFDDACKMSFSDKKDSVMSKEEFDTKIDELFSNSDN